MTGANRSSTSGPWRIVAVIIVVIVAAVAAFVLLGGDDDSEPTASSSPDTSAVTTDLPATTGALTTTPESIATTTAPETTQAPTTTEVPAATDAAIWPWVDTDTRYADPVEAATGFAVDYLGFIDPIVSEFMAGDNRSGEVEIRSVETGPVMVVFVRQLTEDDSWWILGSVSSDISVDEPESGTAVTSPLTVTGTALAFEGTVDVELRADGNGEAIFEGFVTGGAIEAGPFSDTFEFTSPGTTGGALVLWTTSDETGSTLTATAQRVFFP
jgi:hypothetical protein